MNVKINIANSMSNWKTISVTMVKVAIGILMFKTSCNVEWVESLIRTLGIMLLMTDVKID